MQIILSEHIGFCKGVNHSIELTEKALKEYGKVFCLHPIIHNKNCVSDLYNKGLILTSEDKIKKGDVVVINAHGAAPSTIKSLIDKGATVIDATCIFVKKIHELISKYDKEGYSVIIIGDKNHAEVIAASQYCKSCTVTENPDEIDFSVNENFFVVSQTTFNAEKFKIIEKKIRKNTENSKKTVEIFHSFCYNTLWRQVEAQRIAEKSDIMLVIGDKTSSNTTKLYDICSQYCNSVYFIENVSDLKSVHIENNKQVLGIVTGASTPKELIMEVFYIMNEVNVAEQNVSEEINATVAQAPEKVENKTEETNNISMAEAMKKYSGKTYREGMRLTTKVVSVDPTGISVAIEGGGKNDSGFISKDEAEIDGSFDPENYKVNDEIKCIIIPKEQGSKDNRINLSKKAFDKAKLDDEYVQKILAGEEFTLSSTQEVKGGLLGKIGSYNIFVPASQIRIGFVKNLADYTNKTLRLVALPPKEETEEDGTVKKRSAKRIVASQRVILEKEKAAREEEFWSKIYVGAIVNGKVKRFANFGAFVSLKYMDALVHCTDLSWSKKRVTDPSEVLELNKNYDFIVLAADRENGKISLGYKQLQKKPYEIAQEKYPIGSVVTGKVARLVKFGAFIELEPGIDGLVHVSQIKRGWIENAAEVLKEGDEVQVKVMGYDNEKITLSIKELCPEEVVEKADNDETDNGETSTQRKKDDKSNKFKKNKEAKEEDDEPREYVSGSQGATIGDLFKNLSVDSNN